MPCLGGGADQGGDAVPDGSGDPDPLGAGEGVGVGGTRGGDVVRAGLLRGGVVGVVADERRGEGPGSRVGEAPVTGEMLAAPVAPAIPGSRGVCEVPGVGVSDPSVISGGPAGGSRSESVRSHVPTPLTRSAVRMPTASSNRRTGRSFPAVTGSRMPWWMDMS